MSIFGDWLNQVRGQIGGGVGALGSAFGLPELGISEKIAGTTGQTPGFNTAPLGYGAPSIYDLSSHPSNDPNAAPPGASPGGQTTTGGGTYNPQQSIAPYQQQVQGDQSNINTLYSQLFGGVDQQVADQTNQLQNQYNQQFGTNDKALADSLQRNNDIFTGRGAFNSSYRENAANDMNNTANQDRQNLVNAEQAGLGKLGQYATTTKAGLTAGKNANQYDLSQYTDVPSLQALHTQLGQHISGLQQQLAGLGTNQDYMNTLNQITPIQSQAATQLSGKLANLAQSSTSSEAKNALAQGYISEAQLTDPNAKAYWSSYFNDLLKKQQPTAASQAPVG